MMKNWNAIERVLALVLCLTILTGIISGCGKGETPATTSDPVIQEGEGDTTADTTATEAPTEEATEAPTEEVTEAPTEEPTEAPTEGPTEEPTEAPTEEPTEEPTEAPTEHVHSYSTATVSATCTDKGYKMHTCSCGDTYRDSYTDALGHSYGSWVTTKEPTATEEGQKTRSCSRCGARDTASIDKLQPSTEPSEEPTVPPTEPPVEEPTVPPTEPPVEEPTVPPTEPPAETIDIAALIEYGRQYAVNHWGNISKPGTRAGYFPGCTCRFATMAEGRRHVEETVDATMANLRAAGNEGACYMDIGIDDCGDGKYVIWVYYG